MNTALHDRQERLLRKWNITQEQWDAVWDFQQGRCFTCHKLFASNRLPCVDHDHKTGLWRGIECTQCNYAIGERHDNAEWFRSVANYLDNPPTLRIGIEHYVPGSIGEHRERRD